MSKRKDYGRLKEIALMTIRARAADGAGAPSGTVLGNLAMCSEPTMRAALEELIADGALEREKRASNQIRYRVPGGAWTGWSGREKAAAGEGAGRARRRCISCRQPFDSEWIGNRMCKSCKGVAANASPLLTSAYGVHS